jgi:transcriptional regulator with XRE-family HTH domain
MEKEDELKLIGVSLRGLREKKKLSQTEAGKDAGGLSQRTVSHIESGKESGISNYIRLANALGARVSIVIESDSKARQERFATGTCVQSIPVIKNTSAIAANASMDRDWNSVLLLEREALAELGDDELLRGYGSEFD